jgi:hypothetical protein
LPTKYQPMKNTPRARTAGNAACSGLRWGMRW